MYVRWKKRKSIDKYPEHQWQKANEMTLSAELVENKRINGKPRQKVIAYLYHIKESDLQSVTARFYFWRHIITKRMKEDYELSRLTAEQQSAVFEALHKVVPLTEEEFKAELERTQATLGAWSMPRF